MRRRFLPVTAIVLLFGAAALSGCAASGATEETGAASCELLVDPGALSSSVRVSGDSAETLRVTVGKNLEASRAERSVLTTSTSLGNMVKPGSIVAANLAYVDAGTGELLSVSPSFGTDESAELFVANADSGSIAAAALCASAGETLAIVISPDEMTARGFDQSLIVVAEITGVQGARAEGALRALPSGFPAVTTDATGRPGVVLPPQEAPADTRSATRILGSGDLVEAEDRVIGQILTVGWGGEIERNSWSSGPLDLGTVSDVEESRAALRHALTDVPIGSQVVVIESGEAGAKVSVIDILAVL